MVLVATVLSLVGAGIGAAAPAHAATATLTIFQQCQDSFGINYDYMLRIQGTTRAYPDGMRVTFRFWGDDPSSDDLLLGPFTQSYRLAGFLFQMCVNSSTLDEDIGEDEIYVGVRVFDVATGGQTEVVETNRIVGGF